MAEMRWQSLEAMGKAELMRMVQMHQFAMHDLALYLDTHPTDADALEQLLMHRDECKKAGKAYVKRFGALKMNQVCAEDGWAAWSNTPWPWEKEAN